MHHGKRIEKSINVGIFRSFIFIFFSFEIGILAHQVTGGEIHNLSKEKRQHQIKDSAFSDNVLSAAIGICRIHKIIKVFFLDILSVPLAFFHTVSKNKYPHTDHCGRNFLCRSNCHA